VLEQRFGLDGLTPHTLEQVGADLNLTRERIRQIEAKALAKLRHPSYADILEGYLRECIAAELGVDEVVVRTWTSAVGVHRRRSRAPLHAVPPTTVSDTTRSDREADVAAVHARFAAARDAAAGEAPARLVSADFTRGLALTVAAAEIDVHGVVVTLRDRAVAGTVVRWLRDEARSEPGALRVVLRLGEIQGADLTAHRWAEALGLPPQRISRARWQAAPTPDAVEALIRIADPVVAGRIAGWRDVLLGAPTLDPSGHDVAF
jgi:hypothetical protein